MSVWWSYRPADLLLFAPATYWRQFELHNLAWWPAHGLAVALGIAALAAVALGRRRWLGVAAAGLALAWAFVAWAFLLARYAAINWAAVHAAAAFGLAAAALGVAAAGGLRVQPAARAPWPGLALAALVLAGYPWLAALDGRPWRQAELFGLAPDPTALATLALLAPVDGAHSAARWALRLVWTVGIAWALASGATLLSLGALQGAAVLALAAAALLARAMAGRARARPSRR